MKSKKYGTENKRLDRWIDTGLVVATVVLFVMILHRLNVRRQDALPEAEGAGAVARVDAADGVPLLSIRQLERVMPDEKGHPDFPPGLLALDGKTVRIQGFMTPFDDLQDLRTFMLFPFPTGCNFCAPPAVNQVVLVRQQEGQRQYAFMDAPIVITGTMRLWREDSEDSAHSEDFFLYVMEAAEVKEVKMDPARRESFHGEHERLLF